MSPETDIKSTDLPSEWDALNMIDTLTTQLYDAVTLFDLVTDNPDLVEFGRERLVSAFKSLEQQLRVNVEELRGAQEVLWHHYRQRRAADKPIPWLFTPKQESASKAKPPAKKAAKKKAKPVVKKARA